MSYEPTVGIARTTTGQNNIISEKEVGTRIRLIVSQNSWMASRPDVVEQMARMPYDTSTLMDISAQQYGMMTSNTLAEQLKQMQPSAQRGITAQLSQAQQAALANMGYHPPESDEGSLLGDIFSFVGDDIVKPIMGGVATVAKPVISPVLDGLSWVGNWPGHIYRTIRLMDDPQQVLGLMGAIAGGALALAAAPITGGASLAALGVIGAGALAGGAAASAITAPGDWARAFGQSWDGERTFDRPSQQKAYDLLRDPRLVGLAQDLVGETDFDLISFAKELAGGHDASKPGQLKIIEKLAGRMATPGSADFQKVSTAMVNALNDQTFQKAVATLQSGKMSPGRDLLDLSPFDPGSTVYNVLSGLTDATFQMAMDPTLILGKASEAYKAARFGLELEGGTILASSFLTAAEQPAVKRVHQAFVDIVNMEHGGMATLRSTLPEMGSLYYDVKGHVNYLRELGELAPDGKLTLKQFQEYMTGSAGLKAMLAGAGTVQNSAGQIQLLAHSAIKMDGIRKLRLGVRELTTGMSDGRTMRRITDIAEKAGLRPEEWQMLPPSMDSVVTDVGHVSEPWLLQMDERSKMWRIGYDAADKSGPVVGRIVGKLGDVMTSMTTMALSNKAIHVTGPDAVKDIRAMTELMRYTGMPSYARHAWADYVMAADSTAARMDAMHGMVASMSRLMGIDTTAEGREIIENFLKQSKKVYGVNDEFVVNGHAMHAGMYLADQADMIVMPDMRQLRNAVNVTHMAKVMGLVEHPVLEAMINKVWKPVVLLRIGFIPRAAGEELTNFLLRGGIGSLTQEAGARFLGRRDAVMAAYAKQQLIHQGNKALELSVAEQALLKQGFYAMLPSHARPIVRMSERLGVQYGNDTLMHKVVLGYSQFLDNMLRSGTGWLGGWTSMMEKAAGGQMARAGLEGATWKELALSQQRGLPNVMRNLDSIVMGGEHSIRRMIMGGVHDDLVRAGSEWARLHSTTIMREASALNAGPVSPMYDSTNLVHEMVKDKDGVYRPVTMLRVKGERRYVAFNDNLYANGLHEEMARALHDTATRQATLEHISRIRGRANVTEQDLEPILDKITRVWDHAQGNAATVLLGELMGGTEVRRWQTVVDDLSEWNPELGNALRTWLPSEKAPTFDNVLEALANHANARLRAGQDAWEPGNQLRDVLQAFKPHMDWLDGLDAHSKAFAEQFLHGQLLGGHDSWWARSAASRAEFESRPVLNAIGPDGVTPIENVVDEFHAFISAANSEAGMVGPWTEAHDELVFNTMQILEDSGRLFDSEVQAFEKVRDGLAAEKAGLLDDAGFEELSGLLDHVGEVLQRIYPKRIYKARSEKWLYDDFASASGDIRSSIRSALLDPNMHPMGTSKSLRAGTGIKDQTVTIYQAPNIAAEGRSFEELVAASHRPDVLTRNRATVEQMLQWEDPTNLPMVADLELAKELHRLRAQLAGLDPDVAHVPQMMRMPKNIHDGRTHELLDPIVDAKVAGKPTLWSYPQEAAKRRLQPLGDEMADPIDQWANDIYESIVRTIGNKNKLTMSPKARVTGVMDDGTVASESVVYHFNGVPPRDEFGNLAPLTEEEMAKGRFEALPSDAEIPNDDGFLYDKNGVPILKGDTSYFNPSNESREFTENSHVVWEAAGPMVRDLADERYARMVFARSKANAADGGIAQSTQLVPFRRSKVEHINTIPAADANTYAIGQVYRSQRIGKWDQMVQYGFDKVIGPSIDAIVRKPMAFHAFAQRYKQGMTATRFLLDPVLVNRTTTLMESFRSAQAGVSLTTNELSDAARSLAKFEGEAGAADWSKEAALGWFRSLDNDEASNLLLKVMQTADVRGGQVGAEAMVAAKRLARMDPTAVRAVGAITEEPRQLVSTIEAILGEGSLRSVDSVRGRLTKELLAENPILDHITKVDGWDTVVAMRKNYAHVEEMVGEQAALAAISDVVPFLDSHEFKTQFADYGKGLMPFWYAEENFMKRWARALSQEGPQLIRKAQLTYMGMKHAGVIRTDASGKDWFVYPGSGMLATALSKMIPGLGEIGMTGMMFQTPTDSMLPGLNNRFGTPAFNPLVSLPMDIMTSMYGELQPLNRALLGDYAGSEKQDIITAIIPAHLRNLFSAMTGGDENSRYASAQMSAMAFLEARGQGLREGATPAELQAYMDKLRQHARITVVAQALMGFAAPGPSSVVNAGGSDSFAGIGTEDIGNVLSDEYLRYIRLLGVEAGTDQFLTENPEATLHDIVNPAAYTVAKNVSASGAPIPSTEEALAYYNEHANYMNELPNAAAYLLPQSTTSTRSQYAYDQEVSYGLRKRRTPEEFARAIQFKSAATHYFTMRDDFLNQISAAELNNDPALAKKLRTTMEYKLNMFRAANPIFKQELESSDGRQRRNQTINEMRQLVDDPSAPDSPNLQPLRLAMKAYDDYTVKLKTFAESRSQASQREVEYLKKQYDDYMTALTEKNPAIMSFWLGVLKPESSLT